MIRSGPHSARCRFAAMATLVLGLVAGGCSDVDPRDDPVPFAAAELLWEKEVGSEEPALVQGAVAVGDRFVVSVVHGAAETVSVLNADTGRALWEQDTETRSDVWVTDDQVILWAGERTVAVRDLDTGEVRRRIKLAKNPLMSWPTVAGVSGSTLFAVRAHGEQASELVAVDLGTGKALWTDVVDRRDSISVDVADAPVNPTDTTGTGVVERAAKTPVLLVTKRSEPEVVVAVSGRDGEELWRQSRWDLEYSAVSVTGDGDLAALAADSDQPCEAILVTAGTGAPKPMETPVDLSDYDADRSRWSCETDRTRAPLVFGDAALTTDERHRPMVIELSGGEKRWQASKPGVPVALGDGVAVYRRKSGDIVAVAVDSKKTLWTREDVGTVTGTAVVDRRLVTVDDGTTRSWDLRTGKPQWAAKRRDLLASSGDRLLLYGRGNADEPVRFAAVQPDGRS